jgi:hypothetical protein
MSETSHETLLLRASCETLISRLSVATYTAAQFVLLSPTAVRRQPTASRTFWESLVCSCFSRSEDKKLPPYVNSGHNHQHGTSLKLTRESEQASHLTGRMLRGAMPEHRFSCGAERVSPGRLVGCPVQQRPARDGRDTARPHRLRSTCLPSGTQKPFESLLLSVRPSTSRLFLTSRSALVSPIRPKQLVPRRKEILLLHGDEACQANADIFHPHEGRRRPLFRTSRNRVADGRQLFLSRADRMFGWRFGSVPARRRRSRSAPGRPRTRSGADQVGSKGTTAPPRLCMRPSLSPTFLARSIHGVLSRPVTTSRCCRQTTNKGIGMQGRPSPPARVRAGRAMLP